MTSSLAALIYFYRTEKNDSSEYIRRRGDQYLVLRDEEDLLEILYQYWQTVSIVGTLTFTRQVLSDLRLWHRDLTNIAGVTDAVCEYLDLIDELSIDKALEKIVGN